MDVGFFISLNSSNQLLYPGIQNIPTKTNYRKENFNFAININRRF